MPRRKAAVTNDEPADNVTPFPGQRTDADPVNELVEYLGGDDPAEVEIAEVPEQNPLLPPEPETPLLSMIPLASIRLVDLANEDADMAGLVASIAAIGVLEPVLLEPMSTSEYAVKKGRRRVLAARMAGLTEIPASVTSLHIQGPLVRLVTIGRRRQNVAAEFEAIERLLGSLDADDLGAYRIVSQATGLDLDTIKDRIALRALIEPLMQGLADGKLAPAPALKCAALARPIQEQLADILEKNGKLTPKDVRAIRGGAEQSEMDLRADVSFTAKKWRPVVEEILEHLGPLVDQAEQTAGSVTLPASIDHLIAACHEIRRQLAELVKDEDSDAD